MAQAPQPAMKVRFVAPVSFHAVGATGWSPLGGRGDQTVALHVAGLFGQLLDFHTKAGIQNFADLEGFLDSPFAE